MFTTKQAWALRILFLILLIYLVFMITTWPRGNMVSSVVIGVFPSIRPVRPLKSKRYLSSNLAASSRLGNHLFEFSSLLSLSRKLDRIPTFFIQDNYHDRMLQDTDFLIPGLLDHFLIINQTLPVTITPTEFHMRCCIWDDPEKLMSIKDEYLHIKGMHFQTWKYFPRMRNELIGYLKQPTNYYLDLPKSTDNLFITCVHIRRTDFVGSGFHVPDKKFIISAIKFVEETERKRRYNNNSMKIVFFGDDINYIKSLLNETYVVNGKTKNLGEESFISNDNPSDSLIYSRYHCDVVLFTAPHSTFGWWLGYLSKGNQVYYTDIKFVKDNSIPSHKFNPDDYYPPHWTPFKYDEYDNSTIIETFK